MIEKELKIQRIGLEGQGVSYDDEGNIYFVVGALPGDRVRVQLADNQKKYRDAELVEILEPSADRRESPCLYFSKCGGCDFLNWDYSAQLRAKEAMVQHVLERGQWLPKRFLPIVAAPEILGYRNRIQVREEGGKLGFLRKRSHEIVDIENCLVAHPKVNAEISRLRDEKKTSAVRRKIEISVLADGSVTRSENAAHAAGGFSQINERQNEALRQLIVGHIKEAQSRIVLELFCGNGNLTFAYLPLANQIIGADSNSAAIAFARQARPEGTDTKVAFFHSLVDSAFQRSLPSDFSRSYDTLLLDPPRTGMARDLERWITPAVRHVIYVSCSPATFSQDIGDLKKEFQFESVQPLDMFPQTRHIELVARFSR